MSGFKKDAGRQGELAAVNFLKSKNYEIIETNFSCKFGEIDIIAVKDEYIVFIEVKTRSSDTFGTPAEAVNFRKRQKMLKTAEVYLHEKELDSSCRFDVIEVIGSLRNHVLWVKSINHMENIDMNV